MSEENNIQDLGELLLNLIEEKKKDADVIILDDNEEVNKILNEAFSRNQYFNGVKSVLSLKKARKAIEDEEFDCAVIDVNLPGIGEGFNFLKDFKEKNNNNLAIVISREDSAQHARAALKEHSALDYIPKLSENRESNHELVVQSMLNGIENQTYENFGKEHGVDNLKGKVDHEIKYCSEGNKGRFLEEITTLEAINRVLKKMFL